MKKCRTWKNKLTKAELKHIKFPGVRHTLTALKFMFEGQAQMRRENPDIEPCWICRGIAKKLGFKI